MGTNDLEQKEDIGYRKRERKPSKIKLIFTFVLLIILLSISVFSFKMMFGIGSKVIDAGDTNSENKIISLLGKIKEKIYKKNNSESLVNGEINISILGNIEVDSTVDSKNNTFDYSYVQDKIKNADASIAMVEGNIKNSNMLKSLKDVGVDIISLSSEKMNSEKTILDTKTNINAINISNIGAYLDSSEKKPIIIEKNNIRVGVLSYLENPNKELVEEKSYLISALSQTNIINDIDYLVLNKVDFIISIIDFNNSKGNEISTNQNNIINFMAENGVDAIFGFHNDLVQKIETKTIKMADETSKKYLIANSMGNYITGTPKDGNEIGLICNITFKKVDSDRSIKNIDITKTYLEKKDSKYTVLNLDKLLDNKTNALKLISDKEYSILKTQQTNINKLINIK